MIINYLAILVLQKVFDIPTGVGIGCQPLTSIMEEKLNTSYISTGVISMKGDLKAVDEEEDVLVKARSFWTEEDKFSMSREE